MGAKTRAALCAITLSGVLAAGCSSGARPKKSASPSSTTRASTTPTTTTSPVPDVGPCTSAHLSVAIGQNQGAAGTIYYPLVLTNIGSTRCALQGYPGVSLVGSSGNQIGVAATRVPSSPPFVSLAPGKSTSATIELSDVLNVCSNPVTPNGFRVYPPNQTGALYAPYSALTYCVGDPNGTLRVTAVGSNNGG